MGCNTPEHKALSHKRTKLENLIQIQLQEIAEGLRDLEIITDRKLCQIIDSREGARELLGIILSYIEVDPISGTFESFLKVLEESGTGPLKQYVEKTIKVQWKQFYRSLFPQTTSSAKDYAVFISYGRGKEINPFVDDLERHLTDSGLTVFTNRSCIAPGDLWPTEIASALHTCKAFIPVLSKEYVRSHYCKGELYEAEAQKKHFFPIVLEDDWDSEPSGALVKSAVQWNNYASFQQGKDNFKQQFAALIGSIHRCIGSAQLSGRPATFQPPSEVIRMENSSPSLSVSPQLQCLKTPAIPNYLQEKHFELPAHHTPVSPQEHEISISGKHHGKVNSTLDFIPSSIPQGHVSEMEVDPPEASLQNESMQAASIDFRQYKSQGYSSAVETGSQLFTSPPNSFPIVSIPLGIIRHPEDRASSVPMVPLYVTPPDGSDITCLIPEAVQLHKATIPVSSSVNQVEYSNKPPILRSSLNVAPVDPIPCQPIDFELQLDPGMSVRSYQWELAEPGIRGENYIFVAPTGSGKTLIAGLIILEHLKKMQSLEKQARVIFLVSTRPLAEQQRQELAKRIKGAQVKCIVGDSIGSIKDGISEFDIIVCTTGKFYDELKKGAIKFDLISLMVMDECHHARKRSVQAQLMERYLQKKYEEPGSQLPQVVGLTASPGAGDNPDLEPSKTIDHLVNLCALLDATSGIKTVQKYKDELEQFTNKPTLTHHLLQSRNEDEDFICLITDEMKQLEEETDLKCAFSKWSQQYETKIRQVKLPLELSTNSNCRDKISTLNLLLCYCQALNIYMDLRHEDAIKVLDDFSDLPDTVEVCTEHESKLKQRLNIVVKRLKSLPIVRNPLLKKAEEVIVEQFVEQTSSRGVFFVRTKRHASAVCKWIDSLVGHHGFYLKPLVITGHTRETGSGMSQADQEVAMENFRSGQSNILVATSVAEEGLDVPACNFVIRFQHVSNEIAKTQTQGRARAQDSEVFTILSSNSEMNIKEIKNAERSALVELVMANDWFPKGKLLNDRLRESQKDILLNRKMKRALRQQRRTATRESIKIMCRKCKVVACFGSDVFTTEGSSHHIVPEEEFKKKLVTKPHHNPGRFSETISKTHKIYCKECDADWGIMCVWPAEGYEFPVLKCKSFLFDDGKGGPRAVAQWSKVPFEPLPLKAWIALKLDEQESDNEE